MTPAEKLNKIESLFPHTLIPDMKWLIARVKQLEKFKETIEQNMGHCEGDTPLEIATSKRLYDIWQYACCKSLEGEE